ESLGVFVLSGNSTIFYSYSSVSFTDAMVAAHSDTELTTVVTPGSSTRAALVAQAADYDKVLIVSMEWKPYMNYSSQVALVNEMIAAGIPLAYISFGSP